MGRARRSAVVLQLMREQLSLLRVWLCGDVENARHFWSPWWLKLCQAEGSLLLFAFSQQGSCNASFPLHLHRGGRCCTAGRPPLACSLFWMQRFVFLSLCFPHLPASSPSHPPAQSVLLDSARRDPAPCWWPAVMLNVLLVLLEEVVWLPTCTMRPGFGELSLPSRSQRWALSVFLYLSPCEKAAEPGCTPTGVKEGSQERCTAVRMKNRSVWKEGRSGEGKSLRMASLSFLPSLSAHCFLLEMGFSFSVRSSRCSMGRAVAARLWAEWCDFSGAEALVLFSYCEQEENECSWNKHCLMPSKVKRQKKNQQCCLGNASSADVWSCRSSYPALCLGVGHVRALALRAGLCLWPTATVGDIAVGHVALQGAWGLELGQGWFWSTPRLTEKQREVT